ncbi:MAG: hypothetical protein IPM52_11800 [Bacteroidetes bacterium]|nr:hypothetical protein [Bacteroidota bacterium]
MKFPTKLNELDIIDLLNEYHSELRKLKQKMVFVKTKIAELESMLEGIKAKSKGRKAEAAEDEDTDMDATAPASDVQMEAPKKRGRKPKVKEAPEADTNQTETQPKQRRQRELSAWDMMVIDSLREKGKAMASGELYTLLEAKVQEAGMFESEEKLRFKLNQILVKLTGRRSELAKVAYPGRGFAYALPEWLNEKGKLLKEFMFEKEKKAKKPGRKKKAKAEKKARPATEGKRRGRKPKIQPEPAPESPAEVAE